MFEWCVVSCALKNRHQKEKITDQKDQKLVWPTLIFHHDNRNILVYHALVKLSCES